MINYFACYDAIQSEIQVKTAGASDYCSLTRNEEPYYLICSLKIIILFGLDESNLLFLVTKYIRNFVHDLFQSVANLAHSFAYSNFSTITEKHKM